MSEPVTIGDQSFINDPVNGWVDKKTKQPAPKDLVGLLNKIQTPEVKSLPKIKMSIDKNVAPITIGDQKFVFDSNSGKWVDEKTKAFAPEALQNILNLNLQIKVHKTLKVNAGIAGKIAESKLATTKPVDELEVSKNVQITSKKTQNALNPMLIAIVNHLASIDNTLKQRFNNQQLIANQTQTIVTEPVSVEKIPDAKKEGGSNLLAIGGIAAVIALITTEFKPLVEFTKSIYVGIKSAVEPIISGISLINDIFAWLNGSSTKKQTAAPETTPAANPTPVAPKPAAAGIAPVSKPTVSPQGTGRSPTANAAPRAPANQRMGREYATSSSTAQPTAKSTLQAIAAPKQKINGKTTAASYGNLNIKSPESIAYQSSPETIEFAKMVKANFGNLVGRFSAFNDKFHHGTNSKHAKGQAFDFSLTDPSKSAQVKRQIEQLAAAKGIRVKVLDEYKHPSEGSTGGHIHVTVYGPGITIPESLTEGVSNLVEKTTKVVKEAAKSFGSFASDIFNGPNAQFIPLEDIGKSNTIADYAKQTKKEIIDSKTKTDVLAPSIMSPVISKSGATTLQTLPSVSDGGTVSYYLTRFGYDYSTAKPLVN